MSIFWHQPDALLVFIVFSTLLGALLKEYLTQVAFRVRDMKGERVSFVEAGGEEFPHLRSPPTLAGDVSS